MASLRLALLGAVLLAASRLASGSFIVETALLEVLQPSSANFSMAVANFGNPLYGGTLRGEVQYLRQERYACTALQGRYASSNVPGTPVIALVDRGGPPDASGVPQPCAFTVKVLNAQNAGAAAVVVVDNRPESLITMDAASDDGSQSMEAAITVPAALLTQAAGDALKAQLALQHVVVAVMSWQDVVPHSGPTVAWELWTNSNDECGVKCDIQQKLLVDIAPAAVALQKGGYASFTPHYITLSCGAADPTIPFCAAQCVNNGRYCQLDPDGDLGAGYTGKDVILENLRSLCVYRVAAAAQTPWLWWSFIQQVGKTCSMKKNTYNAACATGVITQLGLSAAAVTTCMGDTTADAPNNVLQSERDAQVSNGRRGDIAFFPTLIANGVQYRGDMENASVLEFICSGFALADAPPLCLGDNVITDPCGSGRYGAQACAARSAGDGATRCADTTAYPYYSCNCPQGSFMVTDAATGVQACRSANACVVRAATVPMCGCPTCTCQVLPGSSSPRCANYTDNPCAAGHNTCWAGEKAENGTFLTGCKPDMTAKKLAALGGQDPTGVPGYVCACPPGYKGDGTSCVDVNECRDTPDACPNPHQVCVNTRGSFWCGCEKGYAVDLATKTCYAVAAPAAPRGVGPGGVFAIVFFTLAGAGGCAYGLYRWRLRQHMATEVRSIMSNYLPLGNDFDHDDLAGEFKPLRASPLEAEA